MVNGVISIPLSGTVSSSPQRRGTRQTERCDFVAGKENALAVATFAALLDEAPGHIGPLVLYGPHGCGKTHLAHGLVDWWCQKHPHARACYLSGADFARQVSQATSGDGLDAWRANLRGAGLLAIDDLSALTDKPAAQRELLHTLDAFDDAMALIVVTCGSLPHHWPVLMPALRSRLSAGLAVGLAFPAREARRAILEQLAAASGLLLSAAALDSLAAALEGGVPALRAATLELAAAAGGQPVDLPRVRQFVAQRTRGESVPTLRQIAQLTARYFGLTVSDLKCAARQRKLVAGRTVAMYLARELTPSSFEQIGRYFGGRDHTTVLYGCRRTEKLLRRDRGVREAVGELKRMLSRAPRTP